jgi:RimJ/RimL family protein N-acetyltransferase
MQGAQSGVEGRLSDMELDDGMQYRLMQTPESGAEPEMIGTFTMFSRQGVTAKLGYFLAEHATGKGYATQGSKVMIDQARSSWPDLEVVQLRIDPFNTKSQRVAERLGAVNTRQRVTAGKPGELEHLEIWEKRIRGENS